MAARSCVCLPQVVLYAKRGVTGRNKGASKQEYDLSDPELPSLIEPDLWLQLQEDVELLEVGGQMGRGGGEGAVCVLVPGRLWRLAAAGRSAFKEEVGS